MSEVLIECNGNSPPPVHRIYPILEGFLAANGIIPGDEDFSIISAKCVAGCNYTIPIGETCREENDSFEIEFQSFKKKSLTFQDFIQYYTTCVLQYTTYLNEGFYDAPLICEKREYYKEIDQQRLLKKVCCSRNDCTNSVSTTCNKY